MYLRIIPNFNLKTINFKRKIEKQALTRQIDIVKTKTNATNINTPFKIFIQTISMIESFKPILMSFTLPNSLIL